MQIYAYLLMFIELVINHLTIYIYVLRNIPIRITHSKMVRKWDNLIDFYMCGNISKVIYKYTLTYKLYILNDMYYNRRHFRYNVIGFICPWKVDTPEVNMKCLKTG